MAESFDFQINDLKFRAATSDRFPYARATAPFRKEQFDSAPTVGDQSLSGWWTRGQLSFHKGAGLKYYEVLEAGEAVLNRFLTSDTVSVHEPGAVTLPAQAVVNINTPGSISSSATTSAGTGMAWVQGLGVKRENAGGTVEDITFASGTPAGVVGGNLSYFAHTGASGDIYYFPASGSTTATRAYTHTEGIQQLGYAKDRLWMIDYTGAVYTLPPSPTAAMPVAVGSGDLAFTASDAVGGDWVLADSPGPVYLSANSMVYMVTLSNDGSVPTLSAGITVLDLGASERIRGMLSAFGHLVLVTDRGVRTAVIQSDGSLIAGPLILEGAGVSSSLALRESSVYAVVENIKNAPTGVRLVRLDLSQSVEDLVFAYSTTAVGHDLSYAQVIANSSGVVVTGWDLVNAVKKTWPPTTDSSTKAIGGELTTAFHRFGTLDDKHFHEVLVRADGAGTIEVFRVDADGTETSLGSMDASTREASFPVGLSGPVERIALRFVLTRGAVTSSTPEFLGYQIKALPSPVRQRLIKWPLMIQDVVRDRYGVSRGTREGAWTAWSEIEALEESDALVTYTDHRTGETGDAYIESLELQTDTPSQGANSGFGGVGYITLRKVS